MSPLICNEFDSVWLRNRAKFSSVRHLQPKPPTFESLAFRRGTVETQRSCASQEEGSLIMKPRFLRHAALALSAMEVLLLSASPLTSAQQSQGNKPKYEFPAPQEVRIPLASEVDLSALPAAAEVPQVVRSMPPVIMNMSNEMYRLLKQESAASPDVTRGGMPEAPGLPSELRDTPSAVKTFPGVGEITAGCGGFIPSDGGFAVSSLYLVQVANSCIEVENATNGAVLSGPISLNTFFGFPAGHVVGDPRALYDWN